MSSDDQSSSDQDVLDDQELLEPVSAHGLVEVTNNRWTISLAALCPCLESYQEKISSARPMFGPLIAVTAWYCASLMVAFSNKGLHSNFGFNYPFLLTLYHMLGCTFVCCALALSGLIPFEYCQTRRHFTQIVLLACMLCLSLLCANISMRLIPAPLHHSITATTPIFTALWCVGVLGKRESALTYVTLLPVVLGIMFTGDLSMETFPFWGVAACFTAAATRALKSVLQELLVCGDSGISSFSLLAQVAPVAAVLLMPLTAAIEPQAMEASLLLLSNSRAFATTIAGNCMLAFCVNLLSIIVTSLCGALRLQVFGNAKGFLNVVVSVSIFRYPVSGRAWMGYFLSLCGVGLFLQSYSWNEQLAKAGWRGHGSFTKVTGGHKGDQEMQLVEIVSGHKQLLTV